MPPWIGRRAQPRPCARANVVARADEGDDADMSAYREFTGKSVEEALATAKSKLEELNC